MKALLGADADAHHLVCCVCCSKADDGRRRVTLKGFTSGHLGHLDTIGAAVDVAAMVPAGRRRVVHQEIHAGKEGTGVNGGKCAPERREMGERPNLLVRIGTPLGVLWIVKVKGPRSRRKGSGGSRCGRHR